MKNTENTLPDFKQPLIWEFSNKKSRLKTPDSTLTLLRISGKNKASFEFNDCEFKIRNKGYWNNLVTISGNGKQLATIRRSFGGKTIITFENGNIYHVKVKNNILVRLTVTNGGNNNLVTYRMLSKLRASLKINHPSLVEDPVELLILIVVSGYVFRSILKELNLINLREIDFSEKPAKQE